VAPAQVQAPSAMTVEQAQQLVQSLTSTKEQLQRDIETLRQQVSMNAAAAASAGHHPLVAESRQLDSDTAALAAEEAELERQERVAAQKGEIAAEAGKIKAEVDGIIDSTQKQVKEMQVLLPQRRSMAEELDRKVAAAETEAAEQRMAKQKELRAVAESSRDAYEEMRRSTAISEQLMRELHQVQGELARERERRMEAEQQARERDAFVGMQSELSSVKERMSGLEAGRAGTMHRPSKSAGRVRGDKKPSVEETVRMERPRAVPVDAPFNSNRPSRAAQAVADARQGTAILARSHAVARTAELAALTDVLAAPRDRAPSGHRGGAAASRRQRESSRRLPAMPANATAAPHSELDDAMHTVSSMRSQIHDLSSTGAPGAEKLGGLDARLADVTDLLKDCVDSQKTMSRRMGHKR